MDLSVIIPTHRRPGPLAEALESVLSERGPELEVFVLDDGAAREGEEVVRRIADKRVTYRPMPTPTGGNPSRVRNTGWPSARGRVMHFLDDDDRVVSGAYARALAALDAQPKRGVVFGQVRPFGDDPAAVARERHVFETAARRGRILGRLGSRFLCAAHQLFASPTMLVNSACLVRREVVERVGGYDEELRVMEDVDFYTRAIRASGATFLDSPLVEYRTGAPSLMSAYEGKSTAHAFQHMYAKYRRRHGALELRAAQVVGKAVLTRL